MRLVLVMERARPCLSLPWSDLRLAQVRQLGIMSAKKDGNPVPGKKAIAKPYPIDAAMVAHKKEIVKSQKAKSKPFVKPQWAKSKPAPVDAALSDSQSVRSISDSEDGVASVVSRRSPSLESELLKTVGLSKPVVSTTFGTSSADEVRETGEQNASFSFPASGSTRDRVSTRPSEEEGHVKGE